ncbi:MAG TPA: DNA recombination protein RmuC [Rickettsiales bacterium]|nr:DNA recombination protein RmuC [Rickettsiales bacterium]
MIIIIGLLITTNIISAFFVYKIILENRNYILKLKENEKLEAENQELINTINHLKVIEGEKNIFQKILENKNKEFLLLQNNLDKLKNTISNIEKENELIKQDKDNLLKEKLEWQNEKSKLLKEISYNIIQENIKQNHEFQEKNKKEIENITKNLHDNFSGVLEKIKSLNDDTEKTKSDLDLVKNGLLNPTGAGLTSEITLSNILKASGLVEKQTKDSIGDYILQTSFNTQNNEEDIKRPDGIVYLPNNNYIIIDSKSSKHFLELQKSIDNNNQEEIKEIKRKIKERMNKHLISLSSKDYQKAQADYLNLNKENNATIMTIMFLQTEKMLEIIREIDPNFELKCYENNVLVSTPIGLTNLLNQAKYSILKEKQNLNFDNLKEELRKLFDNFGNLFLHSKNIGKGLEKAMTEYNALADTFNKKLLLRLRNMEKIGVESNKRSFETSKLDTYQILSQSLNTIDSEAEEIDSNLIENQNN